MAGGPAHDMAERAGRAVAVVESKVGDEGTEFKVLLYALPPLRSVSIAITVSVSVSAPPLMLKSGSGLTEPSPWVAEST